MAAVIHINASTTEPCKPWHGVDRAPMEQAYAELLQEVEKAVKKLNWECGLTNEI